ncbi:MAG TPA: mechanosensitive ion channel [Burkholderiaceae bacterium]|nr:mechanosensitive ion channel [Burkholderiaceae bacterium]
MWQFLTGAASPYLLRAATALAILFVAWVVARIVRAGVTRLGVATGLDARVHSPGLSATLANVAYGLVWLLALPALLDTLQLQGLLVPVNAMLTRMLGFLPNVMGAAIVFGVGLLLARIARQIVTGLLTAAGSERLAERLGLASALGKHTLAGLVGSMVFALILLPTLVAALQPLGLEALTHAVTQLLDAVVGLIPKLISAAIVIGIAALLGRALASVVTGLLAGLGANRLHVVLGLPREVRVAGRDPSELAGAAVMVAVLFVGVTQASQMLGFEVLTESVATLGLLFARLLAAALVLGVGMWLAAWAGRAVLATGIPNAEVLAWLARVAVMFFAVAMALLQAGLPSIIVVLAFGAVAGSVAVGIAIAVGLGGRQVAGRLLEQVVASFRQHKVALPPDER